MREDRICGSCKWSKHKFLLLEGFFHGSRLFYTLNTLTKLQIVHLWSFFILGNCPSGGSVLFFKYVLTTGRIMTFLSHNTAVATVEVG